MEHYENLPGVIMVWRQDFPQGELLRCAFFVCVAGKWPWDWNRREEVSSPGRRDRHWGLWGHQVPVVCPLWSKVPPMMSIPLQPSRYPQLCHLWVTMAVDLEPFGGLHLEGLWGSSAGSHWKVALTIQGQLCKEITKILTTFWPPPYISAGLPLLLSKGWWLLWGTTEGTVTHL